MGANINYLYPQEIEKPTDISGIAEEFGVTEKDIKMAFERQGKYRHIKSIVRPIGMGCFIVDGEFKCKQDIVNTGGYMSYIDTILEGYKYHQRNPHHNEKHFTLDSRLFVEQHKNNIQTVLSARVKRIG